MPRRQRLIDGATVEDVPEIRIQPRGDDFKVMADVAAGADEDIRDALASQILTPGERNQLRVISTKIIAGLQALDVPERGWSPYDLPDALRRP